MLRFTAPGFKFFSEFFGREKPFPAYLREPLAMSAKECVFTPRIG